MQHQAQQQCIPRMFFLQAQQQCSHQPVLTPAEKQAIARSLSHSTDTAEKHYRALDQGKTLLAYRSVGSIGKTHESNLPNRSSVAGSVLLVQPSSAVSE